MSVPYVVLPVGADQRPAGPGWRADTYDWDEATGLAEFVYRRRGGERVVTVACQPARVDHADWHARPAIDVEATLQRHFADLQRGIRLDEGLVS